MSNWDIYERVAGPAWQADGTVPRPNEELPEGITSTQFKKKLITGDFVRLIPPTKYNSSDLTFVWIWQTKTFKEKIEQYIKDHTGIKIETHESGKEFQGYFLDTEGTYLIGADSSGNQQYNVRARFDIAVVP